eukprot:13385976-Ditylum_brightwellii.AAC.1
MDVPKCDTVNTATAAVTMSLTSSFTQQSLSEQLEQEKGNEYLLEGGIETHSDVGDSLGARNTQIVNRALSDELDLAATNEQQQQEHEEISSMMSPLSPATEDTHQEQQHQSLSPL